MHIFKVIVTLHLFVSSINRHVLCCQSFIGRRALHIIEQSNNHLALLLQFYNCFNFYCDIKRTRSTADSWVLSVQNIDHQVVRIISFSVNQINWCFNFSYNMNNKNLYRLIFQIYID